jgi:hypothetical protein
MIMPRVLVLVSLGIASCGHASGTMMSDYAQDLGSHLDALQTEQTDHTLAMASLTTLAAVQGTEPPHWQHMSDHFDRMNLVMGDMMACSRDVGAAVDISGFSNSMEKMRADCDAHRQAMQSAPDLSMARIEENRHDGVFRVIMTDMRDHWSSMMVATRGYSCAYCSHCGM